MTAMGGRSGTNNRLENILSDDRLDLRLAWHAKFKKKRRSAGLESIW